MTLGQVCPHGPHGPLSRACEVCELTDACHGWANCELSNAALRARARALEKVAVAAREARGWAWMDPADGRYDALKALDAALSELDGGK